MGGAENSKKLVTLPANAAKETEFLKNHAPGDDGKQKENRNYSAGDPTCLLQNISEVNQYNYREQINDVFPSVQRNFAVLQNRSTRYQWNQRNLGSRCRL